MIPMIRIRISDEIPMVRYNLKLTHFGKEKGIENFAHFTNDNDSHNDPNMSAEKEGDIENGTLDEDGR